MSPKNLDPLPFERVAQWPHAFHTHCDVYTRTCVNVEVRSFLIWQAFTGSTLGCFQFCIPLYPCVLSPLSIKRNRYSYLSLLSTFPAPNYLANYPTRVDKMT